MKRILFPRAGSKPALAFVAALAIVAGVQPADAGVIYDYVGNTFDRGSGPFTTADRLTGFVEFGSQPAPGATNVTNVVAFSFSAGPFTLTDATGVSPMFDFDFDTSTPVPAIVSWNWSVQYSNSGIEYWKSSSASDIMGPGGCNGTPSCSDQVQVLVNTFNREGIQVGLPGTWTKRPAAAPSPGTLWLMVSGVAALRLRSRVRDPR